MADTNLELVKETLKEIAFTTTVTRYVTLSSWIFLIWDHIITFDVECELFWSKPWSWAKFLFVFNRYTCPVFLAVHTFIQLSNSVTGPLCLTWFQFQGWTGTTTILVVEIILQFRLYAMYNRSKIVLAIIVFLFLIEAAAMSSVLGTTYVNLDAIADPVPGVAYHVCIPLNVPSYFFTFWIPPMAYEGILLLFAGFKGLQFYRQERGIQSSGSKLVQLLVRDSLMFFIFIFLADLSNAIIWLVGPASLLEVMVGYGLAVPSVMGNRLLINLRAAYYAPTPGHTNATTTAGVTTGAGSYELGHMKRRQQRSEFDTKWALDEGNDVVTQLGVRVPVVNEEATDSGSVRTSMELSRSNKAREREGEAVDSAPHAV